VAVKQLIDAAMDIVVDGDVAHAGSLGPEVGACLFDAFNVCGHLAFLAGEGGRRRTYRARGVRVLQLEARFANDALSAFVVR
jgi:hypothetical protein